MEKTSAIQTGNNDWFLALFIDMANKNDFELGITLTSHGFLVSGILIGGQKYFDGIAEEFASAFNDAEGLKETFSDMGKKVYDKPKNDEPANPPTFIHLKDAKFFHPNGQPIPANRGVWWRGRLSEISGFSLGNLSVN